MSKYQINYGRKLPEHRLPFDYTFCKKVQSPLQYFKFYKQGFNSSWLKYWYMYSGLVGLGVTMAIVTYKLWDSSAVAIHKKRTYFPAMYYKAQISRGNKSRYDNVLKRFQNDEQGLRDLSFNFDQ